MFHDRQQQPGQQELAQVVHRQLLKSENQELMKIFTMTCGQKG
jgi:hypothetical protein